jgi:hypothetical protein
MEAGQLRRHQDLFNQIVWLPGETNYQGRAIDDDPDDDAPAMGPTGTYDHQFTQQQHRARAPQPHVSARPAPATTLSDLTRIQSPTTEEVQFMPGMEHRRFDKYYEQDGQTYEAPLGQAICRSSREFIRFDPNEAQVDEHGRLVKFDPLAD